jgi:gliding motility-associated-like protein
MLGYSHVGNISSAIQNVALRFCWVTDCNYVYQKEFDLNYRAFSTVCGSDTVMATSHVTVDPPTGDVKEIPNIFTPNGDGTNDIYKLAGKNDPCYDVMQINIYNRWGQLVFNSIDPNFEWDGKTESGKLCKPGAYLVIMDGTFGSTYDTDGVRTSNPVRDEFWIHLVR